MPVEVDRKKRKDITPLKDNINKMSRRDERFYLNKLTSEELAKLVIDDSDNSDYSSSSESDGEWSISKSPLDRDKITRVNAVRDNSNLGAKVVSPIKIKRKSEVNAEKTPLSGRKQKLFDSKEILAQIQNSGRSTPRRKARKNDSDSESSSTVLENFDSNNIRVTPRKIRKTETPKSLKIVLEKLSPEEIKASKPDDSSSDDEISNKRKMKKELAVPLDSLKSHDPMLQEGSDSESCKSYSLRAKAKAVPNYVENYDDDSLDSSPEKQVRISHRNKINNTPKTPVSVERDGLRKRRQSNKPCYKEINSDEEKGRRKSRQTTTPSKQTTTPSKRTTTPKRTPSSLKDGCDKEEGKSPRCSSRLKNKDSGRKVSEIEELSDRTPSKSIAKHHNLSPLVDSVERISLRNRSDIKKPWGDEFEVDLGRRLSIINSPRTPSNCLRKQVLESTATRSAKKKLVMGSDNSSSSDSDEELIPLRRTSRNRTPSKRTSGRTPSKESKTPSKGGTPGKDVKTPSKSTPSKSTPNKATPSKSTPSKDFKTPTKGTPGKGRGEPTTPCTPKTVRRVGQGFLTPVVEERCVNKTKITALEQVRLKLHVSTVPASLPCRLSEFNNIKSFISCKINDKSAGCMYISGVPGTGKTATVHAVVKTLQQLAIDKKMSPFDFVEVNGLRLTEARQAYVRIWQSLSGNKCSSDQSLHCLEKKFSGKPSRSTVLLVDELDYVCNKRQDVIYNILDWSTKKYSKLIVLTIANTMDLPERTLKGRVTSRMGLTRLVFQPYSYQQLQEIVMDRIQGSASFDPDAVQFVARKVAAVSGDARRALDICRRATELLDTSEKQVTLDHVDKTLNTIFHSRRVQAIKQCSYMSQIVLRSIRDETLRTGIEETNLRDVFHHLSSLCNLEGSWLPTLGQILSLCRTLTLSGLLSMEKGRHDILTKITLNVSADDIHYALSC